MMRFTRITRTVVPAACSRHLSSVASTHWLSTAATRHVVRQESSAIKPHTLPVGARPASHKRSIPPTTTRRLHAVADRADAASSAPSSWVDTRASKPDLSFTHRRAVKSNIVLLGAPGSGKSSIGRVLSRSLGLPLIDIDDDHLEPLWRTTVAKKLAELGDEGFLDTEGEALMNLQATNSVIALSGSNPLHARSLEHIAQDGILVYLDVDPSEILARCERMKVDRIVGQSSTSLSSILDYRRSIYENSYDVRVLITAGESVESIASRVRAEVERIRQPNAYVSTRGYDGDGAAAQPLDFLDVVQQGLSPDRGLFVPARLQGLTFTTGELARLMSLPYQELALRVIERFPIGDRMQPSQLRRILYEAYATFDHADVLPLVPLAARPGSAPSALHPRMYLMETFHGPTASFKDLSLQLLPKLMRTALDQSRDGAADSAPTGDRIGLLVATSGDTGTAALDGFSRQAGVPVVVLYPSNGVSIVQRAQMQTTPGDVLVLGVDSDFDFCQTLVKDIFNDQEVNREFRSLLPDLTLSSANSMNWGRFLPQIVFSISSYLRLVSSGAIRLGDSSHLVVPTGNFGNILGAVYAKLVLGLPIGRIVCASNTNNILYDFLRTGTYDLRQRRFTQTVSPSIDILVSSNLERFLHLLTDGDAHTVDALFTQLQRDGHFTVSPSLLARMQSVVEGGWATEEECLGTIKATFDTTGELIDPHTAVAVHVANSLLASDAATPVIVSSTAHYAKFPHAMCRALGREVTNDDEASLPRMLAHLRSIAPEAYDRSMHGSLAQLAEKPVLHAHHCAADRDVVVGRIKEFFRSFAAKHASK